MILTFGNRQAVKWSCVWKARVGKVHMYGLAASQLLERLKEPNSSLTVCGTRWPPAGGLYDGLRCQQIIAAPFAVLLGSIGVVARLPISTGC